MLFDSHAHYDDERFDSDRYEIIKNVHESGVSYILNAASDMASALVCLELAQKFDFIYAAVGVHPQSAHELDDSALERLAGLAGKEKVVAIGEIGLDYYYDNSPREVQKRSFALQISLARQMKLPIIVHDRDAHADTMDIIKSENAKSVGGVLHCYSGSVETAKELLDNNFYISVGGSLTFKKAVKAIEVVKYVPLERLLIETDCPYLTPEPYRGKRNDSSFVRLVAEKVAQIKGIPFEEVAGITEENAKRLFNIR